MGEDSGKGHWDGLTFEGEKGVTLGAAFVISQKARV